MTVSPKARCCPNRQQHSRKPYMILVLVAMLLALAMTPPCSAAPRDAAAYAQLPTQRVTALYRRQLIGASPSSPASSTGDTTVAASTTTAATTTIPIIATTTTDAATIVPTIATTAVTTTTGAATSVAHTLTTASRTITTSMSIVPTTSTNSTTSPTETPDGSSQGLIIGGAAIGGLVFAIGIAIIAFRCTLNRRDRQRRDKEMAATLAESFDRSGDAISTPRKGYMELGEGPPTPSSGRADLSQDAYFAHKEGGAVGGGSQDYYNPHYVQERYGAANAGNYGMYEETELSVIGGSAGRSVSPFPHGNNDHSMAYPSASIPANHYAGYDYGHQDGGYYGGGSNNAPRAPQGY